MLSKSHGKKDKRERKAKKAPTCKSGLAPTLTNKYNKAEALVDLV
jgi:hypothetical protein